MTPCSVRSTASATRILRPSLTRATSTVIGSIGLLRNRSTVSRAKCISGSPYSSSMALAASPPIRRP